MALYREMDDGTRQHAYLDKAGNYVLGDPAHGDRKHLARNKVFRRTEAEVVELVRRGFSVRVVTSTAPSLVRKNLFHNGQPLT